MLREALAGEPNKLEGSEESETNKPLEQYMATKIKGGLLLPIFGQPKITLLILTKNPIDLTGDHQRTFPERDTGPVCRLTPSFQSALPANSCRD